MNTTVCKLAWTSISVKTDGRTRPCCLFKGTIKDRNGVEMHVQHHSMSDIFASPTMVDLRQQMRSGERPDSCIDCWNDEERGNTSMRQFYINCMNDNNDAIDWDIEPTEVVDLGVAIDNNCNLKCRTCGPFNSSLWVPEATIVNNKLQNYGLQQIPIMNVPDFKFGTASNLDGKFWLMRHEWISTVKWLHIMGGEPLYSKHWKILLTEISKSQNAGKISVSVSTNGLLNYEQLITIVAPKLKHFALTLSIDGVGSVFEYLRHPAKWHLVLHNMRQYINLASKIQSFTPIIFITVSWMNSLDLQNIIAVAKEISPEIQISFILARDPLHCAIWAIPHNLKLVIAENFKNINHPEIDGIQKFMFSKDISDAHFIDNLKIFRISDLARNEDLLDRIPELRTYISKYWDIVTKEIDGL